MGRRVVLPIAEDLAGLGQGHPVDHRIGIAAAGGEGAIEGAEPVAGTSPAIVPGLATGAASPAGCSPAMVRIAATAALSSARLASQPAPCRRSSPGGPPRARR